MAKKDSGVYEGQMKERGMNSKFANPDETHTGHIRGGFKTKDDIGEKSGFQVDGYIEKKGTPYGEDAKFNFLPPGMDISDQEMCDIRDMPLKKVVDISYQGDGWPEPKDVKEL